MCLNLLFYINVYDCIAFVAAIKSNIRVDCNVNLADFIIYDRVYDILHKIEFHKITWHVEQDKSKDVTAAADVVKINNLFQKFISDSIKSNKLSRISTDIKVMKSTPTTVTSSSASTFSSSHIDNYDYSDVDDSVKISKKINVKYPKKVLKTKESKLKVSKIHFKSTNATRNKKRLISQVI